MSFRSTPNAGGGAPPGAAGRLHEVLALGRAVSATAAPKAPVVPTAGWSRYGRGPPWKRVMVEIDDLRPYFAWLLLDDVASELREVSYARAAQADGVSEDDEDEWDDWLYNLRDIENYYPVLRLFRERNEQLKAVWQATDSYNNPEENHDWFYVLEDGQDELNELINELRWDGIRRLDQYYVDDVKPQDSIATRKAKTANKEFVEGKIEEFVNEGVQKAIDFVFKALRDATTETEPDSSDDEADLVSLRDRWNKLPGRKRMRTAARLRALCATMRRA